MTADRRIVQVTTYGHGIRHSTIWGRWLIHEKPLDGLPGQWSVGLRARPQAVVLVHRGDSENDGLRIDVLTCSAEAVARGWPASLWPSEFESPIAVSAKTPTPSFEPTRASEPLPPLREIDDDRGADAVAIVRHKGVASVSMLQREMSIGHARAARLIDLMERAGIVGAVGPGQLREVLRR
jgi:DNA segregation ATPase FtsK/SpoIIIE-like protein